MLTMATTSVGGKFAHPVFWPSISGKIHVRLSGSDVGGFMHGTGFSTTRISGGSGRGGLSSGHFFAQPIEGDADSSSDSARVLLENFCKVVTRFLDSVDSSAELADRRVLVRELAPELGEICGVDQRRLLELPDVLDGRVEALREIERTIGGTIRLCLRLAQQEEVQNEHRDGAHEAAA